MHTSLGLLAAALALCSSCVSASLTHLTMSSFYANNNTQPAALGIMTLVHTAYLTDAIEVFSSTGTKSLFGLSYGCNYNASEPHEGYYNPSNGSLCFGWQDRVHTMVSTLAPYLGAANDTTKPLRGVFLGDEIACHGRMATATYFEFIRVLRAALDSQSNGSRDYIMYSNQCSKELASNWTSGIPSELDYVSIDMYPSAGSEVAAVRAYYESTIFPRLTPPTRAVVVPGIFASKDGDFAAEDAAMASMMQGFWQWLQTDTRLAGLDPWHWELRPEFPTKYYGAYELPQTLAVVKQIGNAIRTQGAPP